MAIIVELTLHRGEGATVPGHVLSCIDMAADRNPPFHRFFVNFFAVGVVILSKDTQKEIDFFHCERNVIMIGLLFDEE